MINVGRNFSHTIRCVRFPYNVDFLTQGQKTAPVSSFVEGISTRHTIRTKYGNEFLAVSVTIVKHYVSFSVKRI